TRVWPKAAAAPMPAPATVTNASRRVSSFFIARHDMAAIPRCQENKSLRVSVSPWFVTCGNYSLAENPDDVGADDDERLFRLEVAHQHRRILRHDHRREQLHERRDVHEREGRLHDRLDELVLDFRVAHELVVEVRLVERADDAS